MSATWIEAERALIESALEAALPPESAFPAGLHRAMRYSVLGGGKRLRPLLCRAAAYAVAGVDTGAALAPACALELLHAYSLIHDDLPALDDDDLRRGRPACHRRFGEAIAILAGDALQTLAFAQLAGVARERLPRMLQVLTAAAGTPGGMVAGQAGELEAAGAAGDPAGVTRIHRCKTAALIRAAVLLGALAADASENALTALGAFGENIGLAFQVVDDVLDVTGTAPRLGKTAGKDAHQAKATYATVLGVEAASREAHRLGAEALRQLAGFAAPADRLRQLARALVEREH